MTIMWQSVRKMSSSRRKIAFLLSLAASHCCLVLSRASPTSQQGTLSIRRRMSSRMRQRAVDDDPVPVCLSDDRGDGGPHDQPCAFPFIYGGVTYDACTGVDNGGTPWCYQSVDQGGNGVSGDWGNCQPNNPACSGGNPSPQPTSSPIVAVTPFPTASPEATTCLSDDRGNGGPFDSPCVFPFIYQGISHDSCTTVGNDDTPWCYGSVDGDGNGVTGDWGNCQPNNAACGGGGGGGGDDPTPAPVSGVTGPPTDGNGNPGGLNDCGGEQARFGPSANCLPAAPPHVQPLPTQPVSKISFGSCQKGAPPVLWDAVVDRATDLWVWLGDNIYGDTHDVSSCGTRERTYRNMKEEDAYRTFLGAGVPVMAAWDDHDYGTNNAGREYTERCESMQHFLNWLDVPLDDTSRRDRDGIYHSVKFAPTGGGEDNFKVIVLDNRYNRDRTYGGCLADNSQMSMLGEAQWTWFENEVNDDSADVLVVANGIQVLPRTHGPNTDTMCAYSDPSGRAYHEVANTDLGEDAGGTDESTEYETWSEMPGERRRLLNTVQGAVDGGKYKKVVFISGDQHWGEIMVKSMPGKGDDQALFEVTASGINQNWSGREPNEQRMPVYGSTNPDGDQTPSGGGGAFFGEKCDFSRSSTSNCTNGAPSANTECVPYKSSCRSDDGGDGDYDSARCIFPFIYNGVEYRSCTTAGNGDTPWCYHSVSSDGVGVSGDWGNCEPGAVACSMDHYCCVGSPSLTCLSDVKGSGGVKEIPCIFPFTYEGTIYYKATTVGNGGVHWCSQQVDEDGVHINGIWGNTNEDGDCFVGHDCEEVLVNATSATDAPYTCPREDGGTLYCARAGDRTPLGYQGRLGNAGAKQYDPYMTNSATSNYGEIEIVKDQAAGTSKLHLRVITPHAASSEDIVAMEHIVDL